MDKLKKKFGKIYDKNVEKIYRFVFLKVNSQETAEDITSQVFLRGWQAFQDKEKDIKNPRAFLYQIARNSIIDFYRERDKAKIISSEDFYIPNIPDSALNPEEKAIIGSDVEVIKNGLRGLKSDYQDVVIWHYLDDLSIKEISKILGKQEGTVRVVLHRAIQSLKKEIGEA